MPLECMCADDADCWANPDEDFSKAQKDCRCESCGKKIKSGDTVLRFHCFRNVDPDSGDIEDIEADENGEDFIDLPDEFHCERCGEIYLTFDELGYCLYTAEHMPSLLKEYQEMTGFDPERYKE